MSDFDKEAERERLREKYEAEQDEREATQRMSELLLKGATMTNKHCGNCGDPVFRHDGTEFCPSCNVDGQGAAANADATDASAAGGDAGATVANADAAGAEASADQAVASAEASDADAARAALDAHEPDRELGQGDAGDASADRSGDDELEYDDAVARANRSDARRGAAPGETAESTREPGVDATADAGRSNRVAAGAAANVEATLERFAAAANDTDDPDRAREYLAVVRDAAETLRTLGGNTAPSAGTRPYSSPDSLPGS